MRMWDRLWLECCYRQHIHAVAPLVCCARKPNDNCQGFRGVSAFCRDVTLDVKKALGRSLFLIDAQLDFDGAPFAVMQFDYGVYLPIAVVLVVVERGSRRFGIAQQIAKYEAFKKESESIQVAFQPGRSSPEKCGGNGRIAEASLLGLLDACTGAKGRGEWAYVFGHEEPVKRIEIRGKGSFVYGDSIASRDVAKLSLGSAIMQVLFACRSAVEVFPHHIGPSTQTAPNASNCSARSLSAILGL